MLDEFIGNEKVLFEGKSEFENYQVVDMVYAGRSARVLFSGKRAAAQSGIPLDDNPNMLFDYNQRFLELIQSQKPQNILLIGGGVFTLPMQILKFFPDLQLDVVEQDAQLQAIAKHFFGVKPSNNLKIIIADGREYLRNTPKTYDLILIDAFVRSVIPPALSTKGFVELTTIHLNKNGALATNIISAYHGLGDTVLKQQFATYKSIFKHVDIYPADKVLSFWISQNFILIASNKARALKPGLRFEKLKPPPVTSSDVLVD